MEEEVKDLSGMKFGMLTVKWYWNSKDGERVWKCLCSCGRPCYIKELALLDGYVKDCGHCTD